MRIPLFRIWYSTTYTTLFFILLLLLAIAPSNTIYQSIRSYEFQKLAVVGGVYLLTALIVLLVYSTRIYTNRTVLQAIPKGYIPIEDGEVGKDVRRMIVKHLRRSAVIAWDCRPRDVRGEFGVEEEDEGEEGARDAGERPNTAESRREKEKEREKEKTKAPKKKSHHHPLPDATIIPISPQSPPWGHIAHPGWASPSSHDLPNLQYRSVICELPNLIEAKAVSLAPPDPALEHSAIQYSDPNAPPLPDAQIVALLQRPRTMGLRAYLARLAAFGLLNPPSLGQTFLAQYEHARFSTAALTEDEFRDIMAVFASLLSGMTALDLAAVDDARAHSAAYDYDYDAETRSLAPTESSTSSRPHTTRFRTPQLERHPSSSSSYTASSSNSAEGTQSPQTLRTAPSRQRQRTPVFATPRTPSMRSFSDTGSVRRHEVLQRSPDTILPNSSSESSLRSAASVIRLRPSPRMGELPYQYRDEG